jgi:hypothetical protein
MEVIKNQLEISSDVKVDTKMSMVVYRLASSNNKTRDGGEGMEAYWTPKSI